MFEIGLQLEHISNIKAFTIKLAVAESMLSIILNSCILVHVYDAPHFKV